MRPAITFICGYSIPKMINDPRRRLHQQLALSRKTFDKKECLHPLAPAECKGEIVKAHTIQRQGALSTIASNGHVLTIGIDPDLEDGRPVKVYERGIRQASTFTGFCRKHDKELFAPIEDGRLQLHRRHMFLLAYRALSRERFAKLRQAEINADSVAAGPMSEVFSTWLRIGAEFALEDQAVFDNMGKALLQNNFRGTNYYVVEFGRVPDLLCSGGPNVTFDFHGNMIQNMDRDPFRQKPYDIITVSLLPFGAERGIVAFAWYGKSKVNYRFIKSLNQLPKSKMPDAIVSFIFVNLENIYFAANWWNSLPTHSKNELLDKFEDISGHETPFYDIYLTDYSYADWKVTDIKTNLNL